MAPEYLVARTKHVTTKIEQLTCQFRNLFLQGPLFLPTPSVHLVSSLLLFSPQNFSYLTYSYLATALRGLFFVVSGFLSEVLKAPFLVQI